jgi:hypothetical protein
MLRYLLNTYKFNCLIGTNHVNRPVASVKTYGTLSPAISVKRLVVIAWNLPRLIKSLPFNEKHPGKQLSGDVLWNTSQVTLSRF